MRDPHKTVDLQRKGIRAKFFKNKKLGKAYKLIYDRHVMHQSLPAEEELLRLDVNIETEEIPHTIQHLIENILAEYNKNLMKQVIIGASEVVTEQGPDIAKEVMLKGIGLLADFDKTERSKNIVDLNEELLTNYLYRAENKGKITGIPTGFGIFDNHTMGLQKQWLVTIAGRNGSNKTWILSNWILNAWKRGNNVAVFSCEMSKDEMAMRVHALATNIAPNKYLHGTLNDDEIKIFKNHLEASKESPYGKLIINDNPKSMEDVDGIVSELNQESPIDVIFIDSAYRMKGSGDSDTSRQRSIANEAKNLGKKYNVPVICTVQLNRDFAKVNAAKEKTTSGGYFVYGTDGWNQDSDVLLMINQPDDYKQYDYYDFLLEKFRHGQQGLNYILEINLLVPKIDQINFEAAKARITGAPPPQTQKADKIFDMSKKVFEANENAISNDVLQTFMEHRKNLERKKEQKVDPPSQEGPPELEA